MQIIFIANAASIHSIRWIQYFASKKIKIYLITISKPNHETINEFLKIKNNIKTFYIRNISELFQSILLLLRVKKTLIHIHYLGWHSLLTLFLNQNSKLVLTPWGSDLLKNRSTFKNIWFRYLFRRSSYLICDSQRLVNKSNKLGMDIKNSFISMFGVDTDSYKHSRRIFSDKKIKIGSNRKLENIYDVITFIKAAEIICKKRKDIYFYIAGDGSLKEEYMRYVKKNKLSNNIIFLGLLNKKEMFDFYNTIDLFISTSLSDGGLSASIAEAMSFERLVIVSNNADNKLWIKNNFNGYLFETGNKLGLSNTILRALKSKKKSIDISRNSRKLIIKNYSYKKEMKKVLEKYKSLLND